MMTEQENREFDIMLKSILENGTEEVPPRLWEDISVRVDAARRRKAVLTWIRRGGITAAAAAAVLIAVILNVKPSVQQVSDDARTAEALIDVVREDNNTEFHEDSATGHDNLLAMAAPTVKTINAAKEKVVKAQEGHPAQSPAAASSSSEEDGHIGDGTPVQSPENAIVEDFASEQGFFSDSDSQDRRTGIATAVELSGLATGNTISASSARTAIPWKGQATVRDRISETGESTYSIPVSVGVGVKIIFTPRWALGVGVNYSILGRKFAGTYTDDNGIRTSFSDIRNTLHYIGIPLNAYFSIISKDFVDFYAYAGGCVEKCVSNTFKMTDPVITYKEDVPGVQLSANIGIGAEFIVAKRLGIFIDPSIRYYFDNGQPKSIRTLQPLSFGVEAGLRVRL
ncbi:MAG: porin family protein [Candidatus Cryptobacteroides sp.]